MLKEITVNSEDDLKERISSYTEDSKNGPVVFKWKYKMDEIPGG